MVGLGKRLSYALRSFFALLARGEIPEDVIQGIATTPALVASPPVPHQATALAPPVEASPAESLDRAVPMLARLQRDGRLLDFFAEDIAPYSDAQVGAAARNVHESCRQVLERYMTLEPIIDSDEGQAVTVPDNVDPATTKLIGNVTGTPPRRGVLRHRGWQVMQIHLPPLPEGAGRAVVAPAEVEIA